MRRFLVLVACLFIQSLSFADSTLARQAEGQWGVVEFVGDPSLTPSNTKLQIIIKRTGEASMIGYTTVKGKEQGGKVLTGKIIGDFIVMEDEIMEVILEGNMLKLVDTKNGKSAIFKRQ